MGKQLETPAKPIRHSSFVIRHSGGAAPGGAAGNPSAEAIVARLPRRPILNAREVADALGLATAKAVADAVDSGALWAVRVGRRYRISREEAVRWIRSLEAAK